MNQKQVISNQYLINVTSTNQISAKNSLFFHCVANFKPLRLLFESPIKGVQKLMKNLI